MLGIKSNIVLFQTGLTNTILVYFLKFPSVIHFSVKKLPYTKF